MAGKLSRAQEKLLDKVRARIDYWAKKVKEVAYDEWVDGVAATIADELGVDKERVKTVVEKTIPAKEYKKFTGKADEIKDLLLSNLESAIKKNKWLDNYIEAFYPRTK